MSSRPRKRPAEEAIYASRPTLKQKKFTPRTRTSKTRAVDIETEPPAKRRKKQTTMTQLDFGRRSFSSAICDSEDGMDMDDEQMSPESTPKSTQARKSATRKLRLPGKTESQHTLTQYVHGPHATTIKSSGDEDEDKAWDATGSVKTTLAKKNKNPRKNLRRSIPMKSESQDTMTQFMRRTSSMNAIGIQDSEDEDEDEEVDVKEDHRLAETSATRGLEADRSIERRQFSEPRPNNNDNRPLDLTLDAAREVVLPQPGIFKTPKKVRILPVPDSRSPETPISVRRTPRQHFSMVQRSPLQEKSINVSISSPIRVRGISPKQNVTAQKQSLGLSQIQKTPAKRSPTPRRIRDFNARFALLEQENAEQRTRRSLMLDSRPRIIRSSTSLSSHQESANPIFDETQYSALGQDTQSQFIRVMEEAREYIEGENPVDLDIPHIQSATNDTGSGAHLPDCDSDAQTSRQDDDPVTAQGSDVVKMAKENSLKSTHANRLMCTLVTSSQELGTIDLLHNKASEEAILVPSSQGQGESDVLDSSSLPDNTHSSNQALMKSTHAGLTRRGTQDLASDQLYRETQAYMVQVASSPGPVAAVRAAGPGMHALETSSGKLPLLLESSQVKAWPKQSQATTVDETLPPSNYEGPAGLSVGFQGLTSKFILSSSPILSPAGDEDAESVVIVDSPVRCPRELAIVSSSPVLPEPKTPTLLRNLKAPLTMSQLVPESLDYSIAMPPQSTYDAEEDEDDEL